MEIKHTQNLYGADPPLHVHPSLGGSARLV